MIDSKGNENCLEKERRWSRKTLRQLICPSTHPMHHDDFFVISLNLQNQFFFSCKGNRKTKYWTDAICVSYTISKLHKINSNVPNLCFECRYYIYYSFLALPVHLCTCYFFFFCCSALDSQQLVIAVSNISRKNRYKCVNRQ